MLRKRPTHTATARTFTPDPRRPHRGAPRTFDAERTAYAARPADWTPRHRAPSAPSAVRLCARPTAA